MSNTYLISEETLNALASEVQRLQGVVGKLTPQQQINFLKTVKTKSSASYTPGRYNSYIPAGTYLTEQQTIVGDSNLIAGNIKSGVTIFNVTGIYTGSGSSSTQLVYAIDNLTNGFAINKSDGYYYSTNHGNTSTSRCRIGFYVPTTQTITIYTKQDSELNYDYLHFSYLDSTTQQYSCAGASSKTIIYSPVSTGTHFIEVWYSKDGSVNSGKDYGAFKIANAVCALESQLTYTADEPSTTNTGNVTDWVSGGTEEGVSSVTSWSYGSSNSKTIDFPSPTAWVYGGSEEGAKDVTSWKMDTSGFEEWVIRQDVPISHIKASLPISFPHGAVKCYNYDDDVKITGDRIYCGDWEPGWVIWLQDSTTTDAYNEVPLAISENYAQTYFPDRFIFEVYPAYATSELYDWLETYCMQH